MLRTRAYDPECGCLPLSVETIGLVGAPVFAVIVSGAILGEKGINEKNM